MLNLDTAKHANKSDGVELTGYRLIHYNSSNQFMLHLNITKPNGFVTADHSDDYCCNCCRQWCLKHVRCKKVLNKRLPFLTWLPRYSREDAIGDLIAGITVGLLVVPQGLAYAGVAGLPSQFGLYGAFFGSFIYALLGTCKYNTVGSTAIGSLLLFQVANGVWQRAVLLTFLTGIIEILMAIFRLSFLVDFVSGPVCAGFTSAAACIVLTSQVKHILGVNGDGETFVQRWISMLSDIQNISIPDAVLGVTCICVLLACRYIGSIRLKLRHVSAERYLNKSLWIFGTLRNALVVIVCVILSLYLEMKGCNPFKLTGSIPPGLPAFKLPAFSISEVEGNSTAGITAQNGESFMEMVQHMSYGFVIVPLISMVETIAVCKNFVKGKSIDVTQELLATGVANVANSFVSGIRANGGLTRSSVSKASGARTPMSNLYIGAVVVMALHFLTEYFYFIPKAVLAAIIITAVVFQIQFQTIMPMWRSQRSELVPCLVSFFICLILRLEVGIFVAIAVNLVFILYQSARPKINAKITTTQKNQQFLKITPDRSLNYPSADFVSKLVSKQGLKTSLPIVIDGTYVYAADFTAAEALSNVVKDFKLRNQKMIFININESVAKILKGVNNQLIVYHNAENLESELDNMNIDCFQYESNKF